MIFHTMWKMIIRFRNIEEGGSSKQAVEESIFISETRILSFI